MGIPILAAMPTGPSLLPKKEAPLLNKEVGGAAAPGVTAGDGGSGIAPGTPRGGVFPPGNACWNVTPCGIGAFN